MLLLISGGLVLAFISGSLLHFLFSNKAIAVSSSVPREVEGALRGQDTSPLLRVQWPSWESGSSVFLGAAGLKL